MGTRMTTRTRTRIRTRIRTRTRTQAMAIVAFAGLVTLSLGVAGCASTPGNSEAPAEAAPGDGSTVDLTTSPEKLLEPDIWRLVELDALPVSAPEGGRLPYLVFEAEGDLVHGYAGCNRFSGGVEPRKDGRIRFKEIAATRMSCAAPENAIESAFLAALEGADNFRVVDRVLELRQDGMLPLAVFEAVYGEDE